jgi:SAM-dependent methyltransferase
MLPYGNLPMSQTKHGQAHPERAVYALGHTERELERLIAQAKLAEPITRQFFTEAGISRGMRVLDVGSGAGDVAFLLSELVGETGEVVGTDRAVTAVTTATARAKGKFENVSFRHGDPAEMTFEQPFDAVAGRLILMFYPDPVSTLQKLSRHLRPGGLIVFHEVDWNSVDSLPPSPIYDRCCQWVFDTFTSLGNDMRFGSKLYPAFIAAGLPPPTMRLQTFIGGGLAASDWLHIVVELVGVLLPEMERLDLASADEVGIGSLFDRLRHEVDKTGSVIIGRSEIGAWTRVGT